jgi:hypothetical protein
MPAANMLSAATSAFQRDFKEYFQATFKETFP